VFHASQAEKPESLFVEIGGVCVCLEVEVDYQIPVNHRPTTAKGRNTVWLETLNNLKAMVLAMDGTPYIVNYVLLSTTWLILLNTK